MDKQLKAALARVGKLVRKSTPYIVDYHDHEAIVTLLEAFTPKQPTEGAATVKVELAKGILTVRHGDTSDTLISRPVVNGFWTNELWPVLAKGGQP
jgi:hypothetical protein